MKQLLKICLLTLTCFGFTVAAQDWYHDRDARFRGEEWRGHLFSHVRMDLDHVQNETWPRGRDHDRLERTKHQLDDLQGKLEHHRFDEHELDNVIGSLNRVVGDNHMNPRNREILNDDLNRMQDYRAHHDRWGR